MTEEKVELCYQCGERGMIRRNIVMLDPVKNEKFCTGCGFIPKECHCPVIRSVDMVRG